MSRNRPSDPLNGMLLTFAILGGLMFVAEVVVALLTSGGPAK